MRSEYCNNNIVCLIKPITIYSRLACTDRTLYKEKEDTVAGEAGQHHNPVAEPVIRRLNIVSSIIVI